MLKARQIVVGEPHKNNIPARVAPPPLVGPQVKYVMKEDVREQRRCHCSHAIANFEFERSIPRPRRRTRS